MDNSHVINDSDTNIRNITNIPKSEEILKISDFPKITEKIIRDVKLKAFQRIEKEVLSHNGIIHGGYIRDMINKTTPSDIDVCFTLKNSPDRDIRYQDIDKLINVIKDIKEFNEIIKEEYRNGKYHFNRNIHKLITLSITIVLGHIPFIYEGIKLNINIDIVVIRHDVDIEPPFRHLDMSCNALIKTQEGLRLSRHTGVQILDELSDENRIIITAEIIKLIKKSKGYLIFNYDPSSVNVQEVALRRYLKIRSKIKFLNLPFGEQLYNKDDGECKIPHCSTEYTPSTNVLYTECKIKNIYCEKCMITYLTKQHEIFQEINYHTGKELVCPYRVKIDFTLCKEKFVVFVKNILNEL
jgi:hypothetical protein